MNARNDRPAYLDHKRGDPWGEEKIASLWRAIDSGLSARELGEQIGLSPKRVRNLYSRSGNLLGEHNQAPTEAEYRRCRNAMKRRIRVRGPRTQRDLLTSLPYSKTVSARSFDRLRDEREIVVTGYQPAEGTGSRAALWGLQGVHPEQMSAEEEVLDYIRSHGSIWATDAAKVIPWGRTCIYETCRRLARRGVIERVEGPRAVYRLRDIRHAGVRGRVLCALLDGQPLLSETVAELCGIPWAVAQGHVSGLQATGHAEQRGLGYVRTPKGSRWVQDPCRALYDADNRVLDVLDQGGAMKTSEIAAALQFSAPTVCRRLKRLALYELVTKRRADDGVTRWHSAAGSEE